jgi:hypothetical protein
VCGFKASTTKKVRAEERATMDVSQMKIPKVNPRVMPMAEKEIEAGEIEMDLRLRSL